MTQTLTPTRGRNGLATFWTVDWEALGYIASKRVDDSYGSTTVGIYLLNPDAAIAATVEREGGGYRHCVSLPPVPPVRSEILDILRQWPGRSEAEIKASVPPKTSGVPAALKLLVEGQVIERYLDHYKTARYRLKPIDSNP